jgi:VCBS repeat-containing protein
MALMEMSGTLTGSVTEDTLYTTDGTATVSQATSPGHFLNGRFDGLYGALEIDAAGHWIYTLNNALDTVQGLGLNTFAHDYFGLTWYSSDTGGVFVQGMVDIEVRGVNDPAVIGGTLAVSFDVSAATSTTGIATIDDADSGEKEFAPATLTGSFGTLTIDKDGNWLYDLLPGARTRIQDEGKSGTDTFSVQGVDGTAAALVVSVHAGTGVQTGTTGADTFVGSAGSEQFDGLAGLDTVIYSGARATYNVARTISGSYTANDTVGSGGTDTLTNIERIQFADKKLALDLTSTGNAGQAMEFIGTVAPVFLNDLAIRGSIIGLFDQGYTMLQLSQLALDYNLLPHGTNAELANQVYRNVLPALGEPAPDMTNALVGYIQANGQANFIATVAGFSINVDLVGLQQTGLEFQA